MELEGKTAVVTGGSRGIGRAVCVRLASMGAMVYINFVSRSDAAEEVLNDQIRCRGCGWRPGSF
jgi:3-oxoacyl-[acyl-carrier protein] reductase